MRRVLFGMLMTAIAAVLTGCQSTGSSSANGACGNTGFCAKLKGMFGHGQTTPPPMAAAPVYPAPAPCTTPVAAPVATYGAPAYATAPVAAYTAAPTYSAPAPVAISGGACPPGCVPASAPACPPGCMPAPQG